MTKEEVKYSGDIEELIDDLQFQIDFASVKIMEETVIYTRTIAKILSRYRTDIKPDNYEAEGE